MKFLYILNRLVGVSLSTFYFLFLGAEGGGGGVVGKI